jgi:hypothetical protein
VMYVADAVGGRSQTAHRIAIERLAHVGAVPTTALSVVTELFRDWASPLAGPARDVIYWYFKEIPKHTNQVGGCGGRSSPLQPRGFTEDVGPAGQATSASSKALVGAAQRLTKLTARWVARFD